MPQGVTSESVAAEKNYVRGQKQRAEPEPELLPTSSRIDEPEGFPHVIREHDDEKQGDVKEIPVDVLEDQWKRRLSPIAFARLTHGAVGRVRPERFVVRAAVVVTGEAEQPGERQNEQGG